MQPRAEERVRALCQGLAQGSPAVWILVAGVLLVTLDITIKRGVGGSSVACDFLPDVAGLVLVALAAGRLRLAARGLGGWNRPLGSSAVVFWVAAPVAILEFLPSVRSSVWMLPLVAGYTTGIAEVVVYGVLAAWTREAGILRAAMGWRVIQVVTIISLALPVVLWVMRKLDMPVRLGRAGGVLAVLLLVAGCVALLYAAWETTRHPEVRRWRGWGREWEWAGRTGEGAGS